MRPEEHYLDFRNRKEFKDMRHLFTPKRPTPHSFSPLEFRIMDALCIAAAFVMCWGFFVSPF